jgi:hypothetical protein
MRDFRQWAGVDYPACGGLYFLASLKTERSARGSRIRHGGILIHGNVATFFAARKSKWAGVDSNH